MAKELRPEEEPYCLHCNYPLKGLVDSSKCPECGRPFVEILVRNSFPGASGNRYQSKTRLWGLPLVSIASGPHGNEKVGKPVGIIAIGDYPKGVLAIGGFATGVIAIGGFARGAISMGGFSIGLVSIGGFTIGALAGGGFAAGLYAIGGMVIKVLGGGGGFVIPVF